MFIIGAGFAGLSAASRLSAEHDVIVISKTPWCEFLPNIHELISFQKSTAALRLDAAGRIEALGHRFVLDEVDEIDLATRSVRARSSGEFGFDALVVAVGGVNATRGVVGADEFAMPFKSVEDCARIGARLQDLSARNPRSRVAIVGGGLEGVEALGEMLRAFPDLRVTLVDGGSRLLPSAPASLDRTVRRESEAFDVEISVSTRVGEVRADGIVTAAGAHMPGELTIWTGGPTGAPLLYSAGLAPEEGAWGPVEASLEVAGAPGVFLAGDAAQFDDSLSKQAYHAIDMGVCAAENVERRLRGKPLQRFEPAEKPMLVSFGHLGCFLVVGDWALFGPSISLMKEAVYQLVSTQLVPPTDLSTTWAAGRRLTGALPDLSWPDPIGICGKLASAFDLRLLAPS